MIFACWLCLGSGHGNHLSADEAASNDGVSQTEIAFFLASGRVFRGEIDPRTDDAQLWLRSERSGAVMIRPIQWNRVVYAEWRDSAFSGEELRGLVEQVRREISIQPTENTRTAKIELIGAPESATNETLAVPIPQRRVVSLAIDARVGRWDENVEPDGLIVRVYPLDAEGQIVPIRGTLNVDLRIQPRNVRRTQPPFRGAGHWTEAVAPDDFTNSGTTFRLRFQHIHPEFFDLGSSSGLVHASLVVPGQGTFEASAYVAFLRPFNPIRDRLQAATRHGDYAGRRYFADERTDSARH